MNWWNSYWFRPAPLLDLAILRIVAVGLQLWLMLYHSNLTEFLHERAMYMSAFVSKMVEPGTEWMNGYTLQYILITDGMRWDSPLAQGKRIPIKINELQFIF
jgi:hypothetical protein